MPQSHLNMFVKGTLSGSIHQPNEVRVNTAQNVNDVRSITKVVTA